MNEFRFYTKEFNNVDEAQDWLNSFDGAPEVVGHSAYACGDPTNYASGVIITVKAPIQNHE